MAIVNNSDEAERVLWVSSQEAAFPELFFCFRPYAAKNRTDFVGWDGFGLPDRPKTSAKPREQMMRQSSLLALCGPSGAGKTTLLRAIVEHRSLKVYLLQRTTTRLARKGELENLEYEFVNRSSFLSSLARDDFADYSEHNGTLYGIRRSLLESHLSSPLPGIFVSGTSAAIKLKKTYPDHIKVVFIYPGDADELRRDALNPKSPPNRELYRRLAERVSADVHQGAGDREHWIDLRMTRSLSRVACLLNEMNHGLDVTVIRNGRNEHAEAVSLLEAELVAVAQPNARNSTSGVLHKTYSNAHLPRKRVGATALYVNSARAKS